MRKVSAVAFGLALTLLLVGKAYPVDMDYVMVRDLNEDRMMKYFGKIPGSKLMAEDLAEMTSDTFEGDTLRLLAVLVEWTDRPGTYSRESFESFFFSRNEYPGGSVADYFHEVSYGKVAVTGDVVDWVNAGYYDNSFLFSTLFDQLDLIVDFSLYDGDGNKKVDAVCFVRSGNGEEDSGDPNDIWSFAAMTTSGWGPYDNVRVNTYNTSPETRPLRDSLDPTKFTGESVQNRIRVFCHELSHNLGLPDLYDYDRKLDHTTYYTDGDWNDHPLVDWCLMGYYGYGHLGIGSDVPSHLCGWSKMQLDWITPVTVAEDFVGVITLNSIETQTENSLYALPIDDVQGEYFLLEYRNPSSMAMFDKLDSDFSCYFWPNLAYGCDPLDRGLLITHIHDSVTAEDTWFGLNNGTPSYPHYTVSVEDAGYNPSRPASSNPEGHVTDSAQWWYPYETRKGALFSSDVPGQKEFGPLTTPNSDGYNGSSGIYVRVESMDSEQIQVFVNMNTQEYCCINRGDINHDHNLSGLDLLYFINYLWGDGPAPECAVEADVDGNGEIEPIDLIFLVHFFWNDGQAPPVCSQS